MKLIDAIAELIGVLAWPTAVVLAVWLTMRRTERDAEATGDGAIGRCGPCAVVVWTRSSRRLVLSGSSWLKTFGSACRAAAVQERRVPSS
ncbi:hypothetical protein [Nonomuraea monospora]|uniref:hypothetical protein n=1 Tax=Nonomuraea monospora TaxID=568818 RepID=UPI0031DD51E9